MNETENEKPTATFANVSVFKRTLDIGNRSIVVQRNVGKVFDVDKDNKKIERPYDNVKITDLTSKVSIKFTDDLRDALHDAVKADPTKPRVQ